MFFLGLLRFALMVLLLPVIPFSMHGNGLKTLQARTAPQKISFSYQKQILYAQLDLEQVLVSIPPLEGEGLQKMAQRVLAKEESSELKKYLYHDSPLSGVPVVLPLLILKNEFQLAVLKALFPKDKASSQGWIHQISSPRESLSLITILFTASLITPRQLAKKNRVKPHQKLSEGDQILIPWNWIRPELGLHQPSVTTPNDMVTPSEKQVKASDPILTPVLIASTKVKPPLVLKKDQQGKLYAYYCLEKGKTIYSGVIIRFTGRLLTNEVNSLSKKLLALNGISSEKQIRPGVELKIPLEWLSDDYLTKAPLPLSKKEEARAKTRSAGKKTAQQSPIHSNPGSASSNTHRMHVILDAGHGGNDPGAIAGSKRKGDLIFEDEAVYDIMLRTKKLLESQGYVVHPTIADPNQKNPIKQLNQQKDEDEMLLVHPSYPLKRSQYGVNLRVYLINHIYNQLVKRDHIPQENIIFVSIHADALHESARGMMVYYPDPLLRAPAFRLHDPVYKIHKEFSDSILFTKTANRLAGERSSEFAHEVLRASKRLGLPIAENTPVRSSHYRREKTTLPAILRYSQVPTSVLVEVANLNNKEDRKNMLNSATREKFAKGLAASIRSHFSPPPSLQITER